MNTHKENTNSLLVIHLETMTVERVYFSVDKTVQKENVPYALQKIVEAIGVKGIVLHEQSMTFIGNY